MSAPAATKPAVAALPAPNTATAPPFSPLREARKWGRMFAVFAQDALAYRAVAVIWLLTDVIPTLTNALIWLSAFRNQDRVAGFDKGGLVAYFLTILVVTNFVQCHQMWEIAADIKEGRFSAYLLRPFSYRAMSYLGFLAWRILRTVLAIPFLIGAAFAFRGLLSPEMFHFTPAFWLTLVLGHFVSFFVTYAFGLSALYLVETRSLFNFWYIPVVLFNGQFAPISAFPPVAQALANILPFRYTVALPAEVLLGRMTPAQVQHGIGMQVGWVVASYLLGIALWRHGTKRFTGVGL